MQTRPRADPQRDAPPYPALVRDRAKRLDRLGDRVWEDPCIRQLLNERLKAALPALMEYERHDVSATIRAMVSGWDTYKTAGRIKLDIDRALQGIRINGTPVGGVGELRIDSFSHGLLSGLGSLGPSRRGGPVRGRVRLAGRRARADTFCPKKAP